MIQISNDLNNHRLQGVITFLALGIDVVTIRAELSMPRNRSISTAVSNSFW